MKNKLKFFGITFVVISGLLMGGCNSSSEIPGELHGTWNWSEASKFISIVIDSSTILYSEAGAGDPNDNGSFTITVNKASSQKVPSKFSKDYPNGYSLKGKITSSNVPNKPVGYEGVVNIYINTAKTNLIHDINDDRIFSKE